MSHGDLSEGAARLYRKLEEVAMPPEEADAYIEHLRSGGHLVKVVTLQVGPKAGRIAFRLLCGCHTLEQVSSVCPKLATN